MFYWDLCEILPMLKITILLKSLLSESCELVTLIVMILTILWYIGKIEIGSVWSDLQKLLRFIRFSLRNILFTIPIEGQIPHNLLYGRIWFWEMILLYVSRKYLDFHLLEYMPHVKTSCEVLVFWHFVVNCDWLFTSKLQIILTDTPTLKEDCW